MEKSDQIAGKYFYKYIHRNLLWIFLLCFIFCVSIVWREYSHVLLGSRAFALDLDYSNNGDVDLCSGRYIYMYDLPSRFNFDMIVNCSSLNKWHNMCPYVLNMGFGLPVYLDSDDYLSKKSICWFSTNQFSLEIIFHEKMKTYECLTENSSLALAIYVPFYAGLDVGRYLWEPGNNSRKDAVSLALVNWLAKQREWKYMWGRDHFLVTGRIAMDFQRETEKDIDWGNKLLLLPEIKNMTILSIESNNLWGEKNQLAIPYPTYFHPSNDDDVLEWQKFILKQKRNNLFTFLGAPRPNSFRNKIITQCLNAPKHCSFFDCNNGLVNCNEPGQIMRVFLNSTFCLQPRGDSFTRRSTFDSILAGCIPVFFNPESAYKQYKWYFPANYTKYSVFIPEDLIRDGDANIIEKTLLEISELEILAMRKHVSHLIPKIIYRDPVLDAEDTLDDAFDIAIRKVLEKVARVRKELEGETRS